MTEVILNDECMHCNDRECHDGEHFCNYAMTDNSFYKNAKMYKGLEVIQRPTYEELEKENAELKSENQKWKDEWQEQVQKATDEGYARTLQTIQLTKAKELLERFLGLGNLWDLDCKDYFPLRKEAEQFLKE